MTAENWDECCPHCKAKQGRLYDAFRASDYSGAFETKCEACGRLIAVRAVEVWEFALSKPKQTPGVTP